KRQISSHVLNKYEASRVYFLSNIPDSYFLNAIDFVKDRYEGVLNQIESAPSHEITTLNRILSNITNKGLIRTFERWKKNKLSELDVNDVRDIAIFLEKIDPVSAFKLMSIASKSRPNGKLINDKMNQYKVAVERVNLS
ncbi:hypothetical protein RCJ22_27455, partial [Vibrio sp. FNV 38]|nr:hypothetical protein [Vibrio sp. FNV 38]